jgi:hypothetical protein
LSAGVSGHAEPPFAAKTPAKVDATTLHHKVMCGYQGWFRCPGDKSDRGWLHWSRDRARIAPDTLTFEMWPDMTEYGDDERFRAPGFEDAEQGPAFLFSSDHPQTVERHFSWMQTYGIDGAFVQRFLVNLRNPSFDRVLSHVRQSASKTGRAYAICYDLSGAPRDRLFDQLVNDWKRLVDEEHITGDDRYLHHKGKPVLFVWGFYSDRFGPELAHRIIDFFQHDDRYRATLIGGCDWRWRTERDPEWARAFRRFDIISPWNVGNATVEQDQKQAATGTWKDDLAEARRLGKEFLPVIYPGFGWTNLKGPQSVRQTIPRLHGEFYWRQFAAASEVGADMAYVAMFDEVDEATAIFKVTNSPPTQAKFTTYEGLPSDWYLRLTGAGAEVLRGERRATTELPIRP